MQKSALYSNNKKMGYKNMFAGIIKFCSVLFCSLFEMWGGGGGGGGSEFGQ